jgi:hypothetical protein
MSCLKSQIIPEKSRTTILNLLRIPLNIVVIFVLFQRWEFMNDVVGLGFCAVIMLPGLMVSYGFYKKRNNEGFFRL